MEHDELIKYLTTRTNCALKSNRLSLAYETHGMIELAVKLKAVRYHEVKELDSRLCREVINNPKAEFRTIV